MKRKKVFLVLTFAFLLVRCVSSSEPCKDKKALVLRVLQCSTNNQLNKLGEYFTNLDSESVFYLKQASLFVKEYGMPKGENIFCNQKGNNLILTIPFPLKKELSDTLDSKAVFFWFNSKENKIQKLLTVDIPELKRNVESESSNFAKEKKYPGISLKKLNVDDLYSIQVNYLNIKDSFLDNLNGKNFYSTVDYSSDKNPLLKKAVQLFLADVFQGPTVKKIAGPMPYGQIGNPEQITVFLDFKMENDIYENLGIKCIISDNGVKEQDENFLVVEYEGGLNYYEKTEKNVFLLKQILHHAYKND